MSSHAFGSEAKAWRFAHFGTFDVENYGDLLFPLILERRLAKENCEWVHVSPVGGEPVWGDCVPTISTHQAMTEKFDGIVVGGGHIIHGQASDVSLYASSGDAGLFAYADLWLGATLLANDLEVPIVWNAPGVPGSFGSGTATLIEWAAAEAAYVSVRDSQSRAFLEKTGFGGEIRVELDTALEVDRLWSTSELDEASRNAFSTRQTRKTKKTIAIHFTSRYLQVGIQETADLVDDLCRACDGTAILLALGPCHGDAKLQLEIGQAMKTSPLIVDKPLSLREIAACIRDSEFYLGSSLHGAITATAFGRPAIMVAREVDGGPAKFTGFIASQRPTKKGLESPLPRFLETWREGFSAARDLNDHLSKSPSPADQSEMSSARIQAALDQHWAALADSLFRDPENVGEREKRKQGRARLATLVDEFAPRRHAYHGILLDQARSAGQFREASQKNAQRFREISRLYRDLKNR